MEDRTFSIIRFFSDRRESELVANGFTREQVDEYLEDKESTEGVLDDGTKWFDGFQGE